MERDPRSIVTKEMLDFKKSMFERGSNIDSTVRDLRWFISQKKNGSQGADDSHLWQVMTESYKDFNLDDLEKLADLLAAD